MPGYAVGDDHRRRDPARAIVEAVEDSAVQATTTVEAIQEFVHVRGRRRRRADAAALGRAYATLLSPLLQPSEEHLVAGLRLFQREEALGSFDAVLAAAALATDAMRWCPLIARSRTSAASAGSIWPAASS